MHPTVQAHPTQAHPIPRAAWLRLLACTGAAALLQLDGTLITVALPSVARSLRVSGASTSIVLSAYFGAYALALLPGGALVDRFGARRLALWGLGAFAFGAAAGALATSMAMLAATRVLQGVGAGLVSPAALAGAVSGFPPERRGGALGIWGASAGVATLLGPLLGGVLTVALGWRADWWALVPLTLVCIVAISAHLPRIARDDAAASRRASPAATPAPTLDGVVFAATLIAALTFAVMVGAFYLAQQYLQRVAGFSALQAASVLVLVALLVSAAAPLAGRLADRYGERLPALFGFLAAGAGLGVLGIPGVSLRSPLSIPLLIPVGLGLGMLFVPTSRAALNAVPLAAHGRASAMLSIGRLLGAAAGAGLAGAALSGGPSASRVHAALLVACALCLLVGTPLAARLPGRAPRLALDAGVPADEPSF